MEVWEVGREVDRKFGREGGKEVLEVGGGVDRKLGREGGKEGGMGGREGGIWK